MRYEIVFAYEAVEDLNALEARDRANVRDRIEQHLRHEPTKTSKSRIKRLQGLSRPQFRLRVGNEFRVFYDVDETASDVAILAIVRKTEAAQWLTRHGESDETSDSTGD